MSKNSVSQTINTTPANIILHLTRELIANYKKFCDWFEKYLPLAVVGSFIVGIFISNIPAVADAVFSGMDGFVELYGTLAPLVIFIILAPSLAQMGRARSGKRGDFVTYAISWLSLRRLFSLVWAVLFTWAAFDLSFFGGGSSTLIGSLKTTGENMVFMFLNSQYFYAMYLAVGAMFIAKRYKKFEMFLRRILRGVESVGQYVIPVIPAFMLAIGVYVAQLDGRLGSQIVAGYDEQISNLSVAEQSPEVDQQLENLIALRAEAEANPNLIKGLSIFGWHPNIKGEFGMVWAYILISLLIGLCCIIWHFGLLFIVKNKVNGFSIKKYFSEYWIRVYPLLWSTSSEALATPLNLYLVKRHYPSVRTRVRQFTIGVGSYLSINGTMICVIVLAGAVANILGINLTAVQLLMAIPVVFLIGFGVPGIPGELLLFAGPLLQLLDFPAEIQPVFLALYLGLQIGLPDSFRTGNNSTDDCVMSIYLNEQYKSKFHDDRVFIDDYLLKDMSFTRIFSSLVAERLAAPTNGQTMFTHELDTVQLENNQTQPKKDKRIRTLLRRCKELANVHAIITSPRGDFYRFRLLQTLEVEMSLEDLIAQKENEPVEEVVRHLTMLQEHSLVAETVTIGKTVYKRTTNGERAVNAFRALARRLGEEGSSKIVHAEFGVNTISFFLRAYSSQKEIDIRKPVIEFTLFEIADMLRLTPRTVEGAAVLDKLANGEILVYPNGGNAQMNPHKARALFQYLDDLHGVLGRPIAYHLLMENIFNQKSNGSSLPETRDKQINREEAS